MTHAEITNNLADKLFELLMIKHEVQVYSSTLENAIYSTIARMKEEDVVRVKAQIAERIKNQQKPK